MPLVPQSVGDPGRSVPGTRSVEHGASQPCGVVVLAGVNHERALRDIGKRQARRHDGFPRRTAGIDLQVGQVSQVAREGRAGLPGGSRRSCRARLPCPTATDDRPPPDPARSRRPSWQARNRGSRARETRRAPAPGLSSSARPPFSRRMCGSKTGRRPWGSGSLLMRMLTETFHSVPREDTPWYLKPGPVQFTSFRSFMHFCAAPQREIPPFERRSWRTPSRRRSD